jgi:hypothetical protein
LLKVLSFLFVFSILFIYFSLFFSLPVPFSSFFLFITLSFLVPSFSFVCFLLILSIKKGKGGKTLTREEKRGRFLIISLLDCIYLRKGEKTSQPPTFCQFCLVSAFWLFFLLLLLLFLFSPFFSFVSSSFLRHFHLYLPRFVCY